MFSFRDFLENAENGPVTNARTVADKHHDYVRH